MTTTAALDALIEELTVDAYGDAEQFASFHIGAEEALVRGEPATTAGASVEVLSVASGPDARTGLTALVARDGAKYEVALADLIFGSGSELGVVVAAYRRWQGR